MKKQKRLGRAFGYNEFGMLDIPFKISNIFVSRIVNYRECGGCSYCFPHGFDLLNSTLENNQRNWKKFRKTKWKHKYHKGFE